MQLCIKFFQMPKCLPAETSVKAGQGLGIIFPKSLAAFTALVFAGKLHEKMRPVYRFISAAFYRH